MGQPGGTRSGLVGGRAGGAIARTPLLALLAAAALAAGAAEAPAPDPEKTAAREEAAPASVPDADPAVRLPAAALAAARELEAAGQLAEAAEAWAAAADRYPLVADHARRREARIRLRRGEYELAIVAARAGLAAAPDSPLRFELQQIQGDAFEAAGNEAAARAAWAQALAGDPPGEQAAALAMALAGSLERAGLADAALPYYRSVWVEHPTSPLAADAGARLDALAAARGSAVRGAEDYRRRAESLLRRGRTEQALAAFDAALAAGVKPRYRRAVVNQRARCLFRLRRYPEAEQAYAAIERSESGRRAEEARYWRLRATARKGDVPEAIRGFEKLAATAHPAMRQRARYLAALLLEDDHPERARALYEAMARVGGPGLARTAHWHLGWEAYRAGRDDVARRHLRELARTEPDPIAGLRPRYWLAQLDARRDPEAARAALARIAAEFPVSYYGWRAASQLPAEAQPAAQGTALPPGRDVLAPADLGRARILLVAGLEPEARGELDRLRIRARGLDDRLRLAGLYAEAGGFNDAQRLMVDAYANDLARGPASGGEEAWRLAWPRAFDGLVEASTTAGEAPLSIEPELVWAIMREESGYQPGVVSLAGARGLLQIMPETGARLARDVGLETFDPDDLFEPRVNIRLGATYLDELTRRFDGRSSAAIGSYNAGPEAIARWLAARGALRDDEWVETIPYQETRTYVKRVLRSYHAYQVLY